MFMKAKQNKYVKLFVLCTALLLSLLLAVACTGGDQNVETTPDQDTQGEVTVGDNTSEGGESEVGQEATTPVEPVDTQGEATPADTKGEDAPAVTTGGTSVEPEETEAVTEAATKAPAVVVAKKENVNFNKNITINQSGGSSAVSASSGLAYTATGYSAVANGRFTINQGFTMTLERAVTKNDFNRLTFGYVSTQPLRVTLTYVETGVTKNDVVFWEAGEQTFSCLTLGYLDRKYSKYLTSISVSTCNGQNANFALCLLEAEKYPIYTSEADGTYYIENPRYKLGVRLSWGGGINYLKDLKGQRGLTNLINQADTGRLVQQSYYGTKKEGSYQAGVYNNAQWAYNPVQGGDVYQNHSRIIDVVVNDYSVYIKAQPQDWSLNNQLTPSYMENSYTLYEDYIQVDNRFVDFSGMKHPFSSQEIPAFYTVSKLSRFYWYDGSSGWTGDHLTYRDDLNFWGDPKYHDDCDIRIRRSNTETWCAWVDPNTKYGIGLYVPNVDSLLAGKFSYNGSADPNNGATNYVAPVNYMKIVPYEALEYSYLMTTGKIGDIRDTFAEHRNFSTNASLHKNYQSWRIADIADGQGNAPGIGSIGGGSSSGGSSGGTTAGTPVKYTFNTQASIGELNTVHASEAVLDASKGAAKLTATGADTQVAINYGQTASRYTTLVIEYMIPTTNKRTEYNTDLFICAGPYSEADEGCRTREKLICDGQKHTLTVNLSALTFWSGTFNKLRFDFFDVAEVGDVMYLYSITLK